MPQIWQQERDAEGFDIEVSQDDEAGTVLTIIGEVDVAAAMQLSAAIMRHTEARPAVLVVDLSRVMLLSSAGIAVLLGSTKRATAANPFRIVATTPVTLEPIGILGLKSILPLYDSVDAALAA